jgi:Pyruvate/2-oxoacid:ferredoxin oxidoreductase gamma subunit
VRQGQGIFSKVLVVEYYTDKWTRLGEIYPKNSSTGTRGYIKIYPRPDGMSETMYRKFWTQVMGYTSVKYHHMGYCKVTYSGKKTNANGEPTYSADTLQNPEQPADHTHITDEFFAIEPIRIDLATRKRYTHCDPRTPLHELDTMELPTDAQDVHPDDPDPVLPDTEINRVNGVVGMRESEATAHMEAKMKEEMKLEEVRAAKAATLDDPRIPTVPKRDYFADVQTDEVRLSQDDDAYAEEINSTLDAHTRARNELFGVKPKRPRYIIEANLRALQETLEEIQTGGATMAHVMSMREDMGLTLQDCVDVGIDVAWLDKNHIDVDTLFG